MCLTRFLKTCATLLAVALLAGCAALNTVHGEIATYGEWPSGRKPGVYAFDRLPSQQTRPEAAAQLEDAARPALAGAGFTEAAPGQSPDVRVQLADRHTSTGIEVWRSPFSWHGGIGFGRHSWTGIGWTYPSPLDERYRREVSMLLRDAASGKALYEARASSEGATRGSSTLSAALFKAALIDFPRSGPNPRQVAVPLP